MRFLSALFLLSSARLALAQASGTFVGIVTRDTLDHRLSGIEVRIPQLQRSVRTNDDGSFRFAGIAPGKYAVSIRAIGYEPFTTFIDIKSGDLLDAELTLVPVAASLDTVRTVDRAKPAPPLILQEFESRRRAGAFGQFLGDSALRAHEDDMLISFLSKFHGARTVSSGTSTFLASSRPGGNGRASRDRVAGCLVTVFENGSLIYPGAPGPPDFAHIRAADYSGVEFYVSSVEAPAQYSRSGTGCGVLLLWRRQWKRDTTSAKRVSP